MNVVQSMNRPAFLLAQVARPYGSAKKKKELDKKGNMLHI